MGKKSLSVGEIQTAIQEADAERVIDVAESQVPAGHELAAPHEHRPIVLAPIPGAGPEVLLIQQALQTGRSSQEMKELFELVREMKADRAKQQFYAAMAAFQSEVITIRKTGKAEILTKSGAKYGYTYAEQDVIAASIRPFLAKHGFSYSYDATVANGILKCTCKAKHAGGHLEPATFECEIESANANITAAQKTGGTLTTAKRQALIMVFGLSVGDPDTDGSAWNAPQGEKITEHEAANLQAAAESAGAKMPEFIKYLQSLAPGIKGIADLPKSRLAAAHNAIEQKRKAAK